MGSPFNSEGFNFGWTPDNYMITPDGDYVDMPEEAPKKKPIIVTNYDPEEKKHAEVMAKLDEINRRLKWLGGDDQAADPLSDEDNAPKEATP